METPVGTGLVLESLIWQYGAPPVYLFFLGSCLPIKHDCFQTSQMRASTIASGGFSGLYRSIGIFMQLGVWVYKTSHGDKQSCSCIVLIIWALSRVYCNWFEIKGRFFKEYIITTNIEDSSSLAILIKLLFTWRWNCQSFSNQRYWLNRSQVVRDTYIFSGVIL